MEISKTWTELKALQSSKTLHLQYEEMDDTPPRYFIFAEDGQIIYTCKLLKGTEDATDFETNYKANSNQPIQEKDADGKVYVRAESRPLQCTTYFTTAGDDDSSGVVQPIGAGDRMFWDASEPSGSTPWTTEDAPEGMKQFSVDISFMDSIWLKEGTIYYMDCMKGSYIDMQVICPNGLYYMNLGQVYQNTTGSDLIVDHYLNKHPMQGSVPMGDELNTESCSQELPSYLRFRMTITVPLADDSSYGYMEMEAYRERTVVI